MYTIIIKIVTIISYNRGFNKNIKIYNDKRIKSTRHITHFFFTLLIFIHS